MTEPETEHPGRHAAPDDDPNSDPPPVAGEGGEHAAADSDGDADDDGADGEGHGTRQPGADPEDEEEIEEEREQRLDPDNRPEGAQVDNTDREFDAKKGMFTDAEGYDAAEEKYPAIGEQEA
jgi:hypothetical protein